MSVSDVFLSLSTAATDPYVFHCLSHVRPRYGGLSFLGFSGYYRPGIDMRRVGVHTSIAGGLTLSLERAKDLGCSALQIFSHNPRGWKIVPRDRDEIRLFRERRLEYGLYPLVVHTSYLINLASSQQSLRMKSLEMVVNEMDIADSIGADYVVLHTGSASGDDPGTARERAAEGLREVSKKGKWKSGLLLENTAGERGDITSKISDLGWLMGEVPGRLLAGICFDTCHAFAAGYDIRDANVIDETAVEIVKFAGRDGLKIIHCNDSKKGLGSGRDRHEHIGRGEIGAAGFRRFLEHSLFARAPLILETPKEIDDDDRRNLRTIRKILSSRL